jgi:serine/threonine-protein kinase RsbW
MEIGVEDMAYKQSLSSSSKTPRSVPFVELRQSLSSQVALISPFVDQVMRFLAKCRNDEDGQVEIETALREALANAIVHGNRENPHKSVYVTCRCTLEGEVSIRVEDEGQGFDSKAVPDPTTPERRLAEHGRGIYLMKTLMDEIRFDRGGAVVFMRKKRNSGPAAERQAD